MPQEHALPAVQLTMTASVLRTVPLLARSGSIAPVGCTVCEPGTICPLSHLRLQLSLMPVATPSAEAGSKCRRRGLRPQRGLFCLLEGWLRTCDCVSSVAVAHKPPLIFLLSFCM